MDESPRKCIIARDLPPPPGAVINHIGISGGKDSTALLLWALHESGYTWKTIRISFCDTGNESPLTYDYIATLDAYCERITGGVVRIETITPAMQFYELVIHKKIFPSAKRRFCTERLKLEPMRDFVYGLEQDGSRVLLHSGVRAGESFERSKLPERDIDTYTGLSVYRPLLTWSLEDVWAIHDRYGVPRNPLYAMGMKRVGCFPCCMSSKKELRQIAKRFPERVQLLVEKEREVNFALGDPETYRSFFHAGTVPASQRTLAIHDKSGAPINVATIADVFRWALTSRGGQQYDWDFDDEPATCSHTSGMCE